MSPFPIHMYSKPWLRSCTRAPLVLLEIKSLLHCFCRNIHICIYLCFISRRSVASFAVRKELASLCIGRESALVMSEQLEQKGSGVSRSDEMNNPSSSVWVPSVSQDLIVPECRVHSAWPSLTGLPLSVTWPFSALTHNLAVCEIWYRSSVPAFCLQPG